jgi:hypothetical protein
MGQLHSCKRLNDPLPSAPSTYGIIAGAGANLWLGQVNATPSAFGMIDSGYSGNPLGFVAYRPPNSPESWLYISDFLQMRKVRTDGTVFPQGIAPPLAAPTVDFDEPLLTVIDDFNEAVVGSWTNGGTAGAITANPTGRINDTITAPFNTGPGWVEYLEDPAAPLQSGYGRGMRLVLDSGAYAQETVVVSAIYPASLSTTIQAIQYDSGATGPCCIVPASPSTLVNNLQLRGVLSKLARTWDMPFTSGGNLMVQPNTILNLGLAPEQVLVESSTPGPLGTFSVRTTTTATHAAGDALTAVSSFRAYDQQTHVNPVAAQAGYFRSTVATGIGTLSDTGLVVDLSVIGARPTQPTDEIHLSVRLDKPENLTEGRIIFDVDSSAHSFTQNYYYASFRASDLTPAVASTTTTLDSVQTAITNAQIDEYNAKNPGGYYQQILDSRTPVRPRILQGPSTQSGTGTSQWTELFIPISSLQRVGTDSSRTLANVHGVQIYFNVTGSTVCDVHGLYVKGSYGPDVGTVGNDYYYRYRRRSTTTGAMSNPGPYNRSGLRPHSQRLSVTLSGDSTEGDQLDVFRWGGSVTPAPSGIVPWLYVGSAPNPGDGASTVFDDDFADSDILNAEVLEFDNQQPYSTLDIPRQGTCEVIGTSVIWKSGDPFNTEWAPGSIIEINGVPYTIYAQPASSTFLEIVESATTLGAASAVTTVVRPSAFEDPDPSLLGTAYDNPAYAYDNNLATAATVGGALISPKAPGTVTQVFRQNNWTNLDAIKVNDSIYSKVTLYGSSSSVNKSSFIEATNFGFNIPLTDTILGIGVAVVHQKFSGTSAVFDDNITLLGLGTTANKNSASPWSTGVKQTYSYGGPTDTWSATITPTPALINSSNFGVKIGIECTELPGNGAVAGITYVLVTVYTSPASGVAPGTHASCLWRNMPAVGTGTYTSNVLSVYSFAVDLTLQQNSSAYVQYSLDGGGSWSLLWSSNNHYTLDSSGNYAPQLDTVNLPLSQDMTQVQVRMYANCPGGDTGSIFVSMNEIFSTVTYFPSVLEEVPFIIRQPTLMAQPMYAQWGPFLGYLMAVGDNYQPGVMHCTKPNQPDEGSDLLDVEITPPSEPLMNGCMYGNGASFTWSNARMFQLIASSDLGLQFTATGGASPSVPFVPQEVPGAPGLFAPWFFCVGDQIYYGTATGIVATTGGVPQSITDPYLSLLFPHDGQNGVPVTLGSVTFQPPDMTQTQALRLYWEKNHVKFAYIDTDGNRRIIVYSRILGVWMQDVFVTSGGDPQIAVCYSEEGPSVNRNLSGGSNYLYQETGDLEATNSEGCQVRMAQLSELPTYMHGRDGYLGLMSQANVNLIVFGDGTDYTTVVPTTGGAYSKPYLPLPPFKALQLEWAVTSDSSFRLFLKDCAFRVKEWSGQQYQSFEPFRDLNKELSG